MSAYQPYLCDPPMSLAWTLWKLVRDQSLLWPAQHSLIVQQLLAVAPIGLASRCQQQAMHMAVYASGNRQVRCVEDDYKPDFAQQPINLPDMTCLTDTVLLLHCRGFSAEPGPASR